MRKYICPRCNSINFEIGECAVCQKATGRLFLAFKAALISTILLMLLWIALTAFVGLKYPFVAIVFGAIVAYCTSYFSGGKGISYQFIATAFTLMGMITAEVASQIILASRAGEIDLATTSLPTIWSDILRATMEDPVIVYFYACGVVGSFHIWHRNARLFD